MKKNSFFEMARQMAADKAKAAEVARRGADVEELGHYAEHHEVQREEAVKANAPLQDHGRGPAYEATQNREYDKEAYIARQKELLASIGVKDPKAADASDRAWAVQMVHQLLALASEKTVRFVPDEGDEAVYQAVKAHAEREGASEADIGNLVAVEASRLAAEKDFHDHIARCRQVLVDALDAMDGFTGGTFVSSLLWPMFGQLVYGALYGRKHSQSLHVQAARVRGEKRSGAQVPTGLLEALDKIKVATPVVAASTAELLLAVVSHNTARREEAARYNEPEKGVIKEEFVAAQLSRVVEQRTKGQEVLPAAEKVKLLTSAIDATTPDTWPLVAKAVAVAEAARLAKAAKENALAGSSRQARIAAYEADQKLNK